MYIDSTGDWYPYHISEPGGGRLIIYGHKKAPNRAYSGLFFITDSLEP